MKALLEAMKRYLFEIICGVVGIAGIVLIVLGLGAMDSVRARMNEDAQLKSDIEQLVRTDQPINDKAIEAEKKRIAEIKADYDKVIAFAASVNKYEPLIEGIFPTPTLDQKRDFQRAYREQVGVWLNRLNAGTPPNEDDIVVEREQIKAELKEQGLLDDRAEKGGQKPSVDIDEQARVRASIKRANNIRMYASPNAFQDSPISEPGGPMDNVIPPDEEQMWYAQLEVWIQRSVVDAIARINDRTAGALAQSGKKAWAGTLPIKDLISIQVSQYYLMEGNKAENQTGKRDQAAPGGRGRRGRGTHRRSARAFPPSDWNNVFTQNKSTDLYELLQFSVRLVVDARDIPAILAGLCENSFHTPLRVAYVAIPPNTSMTGKIYGDAPVVELTVDFETVMFSDLYLDIMPDSILAAINKQRPQKPDQGT